ncbi:DUF2061 domain-containing protein [Aquincola tertiaricarbonis]|uniref:DUF2061 domain-containing protein n=1 Tax=Aquincola tertiaricarbonis TaxID=391953 RepID=A0ABY4S9X8_AQUTE|nr:DUF2061 domain-containing protein [Aquincola tertiaricarbonis]URI10156.1 DUF2061 domain-containing protein [Aquincola tertiaricarbonis]
MVKTAAFGVVHLGIAFTVTYVLTGNLLAASAVTLIEPTVNMVAHYFFDKHWDDKKVEAWLQRRRTALSRCFTWNKGRAVEVA